MSCALKSCKNIKRFRPPGISFFQFPKDEASLEQWKIAVKINQPDWKPANKYVCSKHFSPENLIRQCGKVTLRAGAVPEIVVDPVIPSQPNLSATFEAPVEETLILISSPSSGSSSVVKRLLPQSSSSSTDSSMKRKRLATCIQREHKYSASPNEYRRKYTELQKVLLKSRKQLYNATQRIRVLERKITSLETIISNLKKEQ